MTRRRSLALVASGLLALALLVVVRGMPDKATRSRPSPPRAPVTRLFPGDRSTPRAVGWNASGRRLLWRTLVARERVDYAGVTVAAGGPDQLRFHILGRGTPVVLIPMSASTPIAAGEVRVVRVTASFPSVQQRPPLVRGWFHTVDARAGDRWFESRIAGGRPSGNKWLLDLELRDSEGLSGTFTGVRLEMLGLAGSVFVLGQVDVLGESLDQDLGREGGFLSYSQDGDTRTVWAGEAATTLVLRGRVPEASHLVGEVARHPGRTSSGGPVAAGISVAGPRDQVRASLPLPSSAAQAEWVPYDLPLEAFAGQDVVVTLSLVNGAGGGRAAALWTEPLLVGDRRGRGTGIVLVSIDTLRADAVFPSGSEVPTMPLLAQRARREGQIVRHHYAASNWTLPAHASMFTGRYPSGHGAGDPEVYAPVVAELPQVLGRNGFYTAGLVDGGFVSAVYGFAGGFDRYHENTQAPRRLDLLQREYRELAPALEGRDFFLFMHTYFVHDYYETDGAPPPAGLPADIEAYYLAQRSDLRRVLKQAAELKRTSVDPQFPPLMRALYRERARQADVWLDAFLKDLERDFAGSPPLVIVTSDHGESLGEGPGLGRWHHGVSLQEAEIRVPLVILHPDRTPRAPVDDLTSQVDLLPTILALAGLPRLPSDHTGVDLLDARALAARREVYAEDLAGGKNLWAAVGRRTKMIAASSIGPDLRRVDVRQLRHGAPGAFDDDAAESPPGDEALAVERRRLEHLYDTVDGLFVQLDNTTGSVRRVDLLLTFRDEAALDRWFLHSDPGFQAHLLEADDTAAFPGPGKPLRLSFTLQPDDTDLVLIMKDSDVSVTVAAPDVDVRVSVAGEPVPADRPFTLGRRRTPALQHPPAWPPDSAKAVVLRAWENEPAGVGRHVPSPSLLSPYAREALRALGYLN